MKPTAETVEPATIDVHQEIEIAAPIETTWRSTLDQLGPRAGEPDGAPMSLKLEAWPGGRWFRDLGDRAGHLWGFVQVIKPPKLIELCGPMFMSYPVSGHVSFRLHEATAGTRLELRHRAFGLIPPEHKDGVVEGWAHMNACIKALAEGSG